ncbi:MAG: ABC transporter ATP-binding protein [Nitrospinota bacterium]
MKDPNPAITIKELTKSFGTIKAVDNISLDIQYGETVTIFGPNGAGKSTLLKLIAGIAKSTRGELKVAGVDPFSDQSIVARRSIGLISHHHLIYMQLTPVENLTFFGKLYRVKKLNNRVNELLDKVGLSNRKHDLPETFSAGMKQRLSIARALISDPDILLLDEPFSGLDPQATIVLTDLLKNHEKKTNLIVTHNIELGISLSDRVLIQNQGKIIFEQSCNSIDSSNFNQNYLTIINQS